MPTEPGGAERFATVVVRVAKAVVNRLPNRWKKALDDRIFGAIFQVTRVTNDAYGWKPPPPDTDAPSPPTP